MQLHAFKRLLRDASIYTCVCFSVCHRGGAETASERGRRESIKTNFPAQELALEAPIITVPLRLPRDRNLLGVVIKMLTFSTPRSRLSMPSTLRAISRMRSPNQKISREFFSPYISFPPRQSGFVSCVHAAQKCTNAEG